MSTVPFEDDSLNLLDVTVEASMVQSRQIQQSRMRLWRTRTYNHAPGLSARKRNVREPPGGTMTVSLLIGFERPSGTGGLMVALSDVTSIDFDTSWNLWPCKWNLRD